MSEVARRLLCCVIHSNSTVRVRLGGGGVGGSADPPGPLAIVCNENIPTGQSGAMNATRTFQFSAGCL